MGPPPAMRRWVADGPGGGDPSCGESCRSTRASPAPGASRVPARDEGLVKIATGCDTALVESAYSAAPPLAPAAGGGFRFRGSAHGGALLARAAAAAPVWPSSHARMASSE